MRKNRWELPPPGRKRTGSNRPPPLPKLPKPDTIDNSGDLPATQTDSDDLIAEIEDTTPREPRINLYGTLIDSDSEDEQDPEAFKESSRTRTPDQPDSPDTLRGTIPPDTTPPGIIPPATTPPGTIPPATTPPGTIPPATTPPGTIPMPDPYEDPSPLYEKPADHVTVHKLLLAIGIFSTTTDISTTQYSGLIEILHLTVKLAMIDPNVLAEIPTTYSWLKRRLREMLPIMSIKGAPFIPDSEMLPPKSKDPATAYYFDLQEHATRWVNDPAIASHLHCGFGELVDTSHELYHGRAWMESVRTTSGQFAQLSDGTPVVPSDCVYYRYPEDSHSDARSRIYLGRVNGIAVDKRGGKNTLSALVSPLVTPAMLTRELHTQYTNFKPTIRNDTILEHHTGLLQGKKELILLEYVEEVIPITHIHRHEAVFMLDYKSLEDCAELMPTIANAPDFFVACIIYRVTNSLGRRTGFKTIVNRHRLIAEAELCTYTRNALLQGEFVSLPYTVFIDAFGLYRNAYHSLAGLYITPASLPFTLRQKLENVNVWMIGPFGSSEAVLADILQPDSNRMEQGTLVEFPDGGRRKVYMFALSYHGDMPQQNKLAGVKSHKALYGCRGCFIKNDNLGNLEKDVIAIGRFKIPMDNLVQRGLRLRTKAAKDTFFKDLGVLEEGPVFQKMHPCFDFVRGTPRDILHSESRIGRHAHEGLTTAALGANGVSVYRLKWENMDMPFGWGRPQNPVSHKGSMNFSEHMRIACLHPFILIRTFSSTGKLLKPTVEKSYQDTLIGNKSTRSVYDNIINAFYKLARSDYFATKKALTSMDKDDLLGIIIEGRIAYQWLARGIKGQKEFQERWKVPNVHVPLHYEEDLRLYGTLRNSAVYSGEQKHKIFKQHAPHTNSKENELQLLSAINISQTLISVTHGMYKNSPVFGATSEAVAEILDDCPKLRVIMGLGTTEQVVPSETKAQYTKPVDHTGSVFQSIIVGSRQTRSNAQPDDLDCISQVYAELYGANLSFIQPNCVLGYWGSFTGIGPARARLGSEPLGPAPQERRKYKLNEIFKSDDGFNLLNRIITITVGGITRAFCEVIQLSRSESEELWAAPYQVYSKYPRGLGDIPIAPVFLPISVVQPQQYHFVMKMEDRSWWWNDLLIETS